MKRAAGVLLYELLTGRTPFDEKELLEAGLDEMRRTIREVEPVKPSTRLTQELLRTKGRKGEKEKGRIDAESNSKSPSPPFMNNLASVYRSSGRGPEALKLLEETLQIAKAKLGPDDLHMVTVMDNLSRVYREAGKLGDAIPLAEEALKVRTQKQGRDHRETLTSMHNLAMAYRGADRLDDALPLFEEGFKLGAIKLGAADLGTLTRMQVLAKAYQESGQRPKAVKLLEEMRKLQKAKPSPDPRAVPRPRLYERQLAPRHQGRHAQFDSSQCERHEWPIPIFAHGRRGSAVRDSTLD